VTVLAVIAVLSIKFFLAIERRAGLDAIHSYAANAFSGSPDSLPSLGGSAACS
jgi:hypothetical protein